MPLPLSTPADAPDRPRPLQRLTVQLEALWNDLKHFPWRITALTLRERFREDHLGLTASSLTFTTMLALVPFFTVALAVFSAFPMFGTLQGTLQRWLVDSLIPDSISRQVLGYLTQFSSKASRLGIVGLTVLLVTALMLFLTIDRTLNSIWRVRKPRPLGQRVLVYWAGLTLGPLVLGASLATTSYVISSSRGLVSGLPDGVQLLFDSLEFLLLAGGMAAAYHYIPNTRVKWGHAWVGGIFVAVGIELAKKVLSYYLAQVPSYSAIYGAFATVPILLIWIYVAWVILLLGAVVTAYLPSLLAGVARQTGGHGWHFKMALEILQHLDAARKAGPHGLTGPELTQALRIDTLQLEPALDTLVALDWVGQLQESDDNTPQRYVLLADPDHTPLAPLLQNLLLPHSRSVSNLWEKAQFRTLSVRDALLKQ